MKLDTGLMRKMRELKRLIREYSPLIEQAMGVNVNDVKLKEISRLEERCEGARFIGYAAYAKGTLYFNARMPLLLKIALRLGLAQAPPIEQAVLHELSHAA